MVAETGMRLFKLIDQNKNLAFLQQAIENQKIANGYLFYGPEGSGSEGFALEFAAMLNCQSDEERPCGVCGSCRKMQKLEHGNLTLVYPLPAVGSVKDEDPVSKLSASQIEELQQQIARKAKNPYHKIRLEKANNIPISKIRHIKRNIYLSAPEEGWTIVVVFDADLMNKESANAFLKILEEPPKKTTIIMTTSRIGRILPTIKSRCKPLYFSKLSNDEVRTFLAGSDYSEEEVQLMVNLADGNMTSLLSLMDQDIKKIKTMTLEIIRTIAGWSIRKIYDKVPQLAQNNKTEPDMFRQVLTSINFWFRDAEMVRQGLAEQELIHVDQWETLNKFVANYPDFDAFGINQVIDNCIDFISRNVYINLALTDMFFKIKKLIGRKK